MKHTLLFLSMCLVLLCGCRTTSTIFERDNLVSITHNKASDYTLLVYRSTTGKTRQVLRRKGVCELLLVETEEGEFVLKERGQGPKKLTVSALSAVQAQLNELIFNQRDAPAMEKSKESTP